VPRPQLASVISSTYSNARFFGFSGGFLEVSSLPLVASEVIISFGFSLFLGFCYKITSFKMVDRNNAKNIHQVPWDYNKDYDK